MGYFIYATIYALVGSMVTTTQEGGQVAMPVLFLLIIGFYLSFNIIRSPASPLAFWVSLIPFFSPITMLVRIVSQTPPFWQIALSLGIGQGAYECALDYSKERKQFGKAIAEFQAIQWKLADMATEVD